MNYYLYFMINTETNKAMITSKKTLAIELSEGPVSKNKVSVRLQKTVEMWVKRNEVKILNGDLILLV